DAPRTSKAASGPVRPGDFLALERVASGFDQPLGLERDPGSGDLYVVEQPGTVRRLDGDGPGQTLIDIAGQAVSGGEQGLLGLAFHPGYAENGRLFLHYTNRDGDTRVDEYRARGGTADPATRRELLAVDQPYSNHNGGQLSFGPDGLLYLGLGDGGDAGDPHDNAQNLDARLGKILRLDVDRPDQDWTPVAYGLRNPWRFSWDRETGSLWIADVGQDEREEIDVVTELGDPPGPNFGWPAFEGTHDFDGRDPSGPGRLVFPVAEYGHDEGCSVTGGYVYRGTRNPRMRGRYVYADVCSGRIWTLKAGRDSASDVRREDDELEQLASFGEDASGELYAISLAGRIFRVGASD
ncbi:MAG: PQQ-dependent sugar dehydrogenase, partial [Actinomycetota bacterium]|nr:PQQ-dependent sugar dehydrogenase [Actinomycetota bacterium]